MIEKASWVYILLGDVDCLFNYVRRLEQRRPKICRFAKEMFTLLNFPDRKLFAHYLAVDLKFDPFHI